MRCAMNQHASLARKFILLIATKLGTGTGIEGDRGAVTSIGTETHNAAAAKPSASALNISTSTSITRGEVCCINAYSTII